MQQLAHLFGLDGLLQDDLADFEAAAGLGVLRRGYGQFADVLVAPFIDLACVGGGGAQGLLAAEVGQFAVGFVLGVVAEVEFQLEGVALGVGHQGQFGGEGPARLGAKALQRADAALAQQLLGFGQLEGAPAG